MKRIVRMSYRVEYTRYSHNQVCSDCRPTYESAKRAIEYYKHWERDAHIEFMVVWYDDGTSERIKCKRNHIVRA